MRTAFRADQIGMVNEAIRGFTIEQFCVKYSSDSTLV